MQFIGRHFILLLFLMGKKKKVLPNLWTYAQIVICQVNNQLAAIQNCLVLLCSFFVGGSMDDPSGASFVYARWRLLLHGDLSVAAS